MKNPFLMSTLFFLEMFLQENNNVSQNYDSIPSNKENLFLFWNCFFFSQKPFKLFFRYFIMFSGDVLISKTYE